MTTTLVQFVDQLTRIVIPVIIVVGVVGNSLNIVVLTRPTLYQHSCSRYFLAHAGSNLFYSSVLLVYRLLADQYQIDLAKVSIVLCKIIVYVNHVDIFLAPNFIVLASIDRWCASSTSAHLRKFNNVKIARWIIFLIIVLFALFFLNSAIVVDLRDTDPFGCSIRADTVYKQVYVFFQACMVSIIPPCLMAFFGLMTIYNIQKTRVLPVAISRDRRTGNQLARMLLLQVGTHIILNVPSSVTYLMFVIPNPLKVTPGFLFASKLSVLPFHASYVTAFFLYILSAHVYRREFFRLGNQLFRLGGGIQVRPLANANNVIPMIILPQPVKPRSN